MISRYRYLPSIVILLTLAVPVDGQERTDSIPTDSIGEPYRLPGVSVEVTRAHQELARIPQAVSLVSEARIQVAQRQATLDESLRGVPGVFATNRHNYTVGEGIRLNIRAPLARLGTRGLQLLQDGIPLTMADGTTLPNNLDLGSAGLIEVIRGPSSVLYGNSAGGVVSVETQLPDGRSVFIRPELQTGSDGYSRQQLKTEGTAGAVRYVVNLNRLRTDGFRDYGAADIRRANVVASAVLDDRTVLRGILNLYDMPFAENPSSLTEEDARNNPTSVRALAFDQGWGKQVTQGQGGLSLEHAIGEGHQLRFLGWGVSRDTWNPIPFQIISLQRTAGGVRSEYRGEAGVGALPITWTTGFDLSFQKDDRTEFENEGIALPGGRAVEGALLIDQHERVSSFAPFIQATLQPHPDFGIVAGARYDRYSFEARDRFLSDGDQSGDRRLGAMSPMVGVTYSASPRLSLFANYAAAYQTPTTTELSNRPDGLGGFNPELEPETLRSFEVGFRGSHEGWRLAYEVAAYRARVNDALLRFEGVNEQVFFRNAGETSRDGLEVALTWLPLPNLEARVSHTYQDFTFVHFADVGSDFSGNREPGAPPHTFFAGLTHSARWGLVSAVDVRWTDEYAVNDANTAFNWAHTVVNARFGLEADWRRVAVRPFVGVDNLLDERYNASAMINALGGRFFEPAPGRTIYLGLQVGGGR